MKLEVEMRFPEILEGDKGCVPEAGYPIHSCLQIYFKLIEGEENDENDDD